MAEPKDLTYRLMSVGCIGCLIIAAWSATKPPPNPPSVDAYVASLEKAQQAELAAIKAKYETYESRLRDATNRADDERKNLKAEEKIAVNVANDLLAHVRELEAKINANHQ